jgi:hypothetical protein
MWMHALSRLASHLPIVGFLAVASLSAVYLATHMPDPARIPTPPERTRVMEWASDDESARVAAGSYELVAEVTCGASSRCLPAVDASFESCVREVRVNGAALARDVDYIVIDDGSTGGVIQFDAQLSRGDRVEISGLTLESGQHTGSLAFL